MEIIDKEGNPIQREKSKRIIAGVAGILLGYLGVHKFILNYNTEGIILLSMTGISMLLTCVIIGAFTIYIPILIGFVEGIVYLTKSDEEFIETYQTNRKSWF